MRINKKIVVVLVLLILLFIGYTVYSSMQNKKRVLTVSTDSVPLALELNDEKYDISEDGQEISLKPSVYNYRASKNVDGNRIVLSDKVDLTVDKSAEINLNFSIYNNKAISDTICNTYSPTDCPFTPETLKVTYVENYQWAVVFINSPRLGQSKAVLNVDPYTGDWILSAGPETDPPTGYFPDAVAKVLNNE